MALATTAQLAAYMQVPPDTLPAGAAEALDMVSAIVCREARNRFQRATTTLPRKWRPDGIALPFPLVVSVDSVTRDGSPVPFEWDDESQRLYVAGCERVSVTVTHGYAAAPADVLAVVLSAAARVLGNPRDLRQETVGATSVTYSAETIGASLSEADRDLLADYRRRAVMVGPG